VAACDLNALNICLRAAVRPSHLIPPDALLPPPAARPQASRLEELQERVGVSYDPANTLHQEALRELWDVAFTGGLTMLSPGWFW
jgi:hypothetical protein